MACSILLFSHPSLLHARAVTPRAAASDKAATGSTRTGDPKTTHPKTTPPADLPGEKAFNSCVRIPARRRVKVNLKQGTDLHELVSWISAMTCKKFIVSSTLRSQKVTLISPTAISAAEAYRAFLSALDVMGLTVVANGRYLKVVQSNWAIQSAIPTYSHAQRRRTPASDAVVTQLLKVREASVSQLLPVLTKMKSRSGDVMAYAPTNTLIITDSGANVRRMVGIVEQLDKRLPGQTELWLVRPRHANASELSKLLGELFGASGVSGASASRKPSRRPGGAAPSGGGAADATRVLVDRASNALIIVASAPVFARMKAMIEKVDVESGARPSAWVYRLKHSKAEQMAQVLGGVTGGAGAAGKTRGRGRGARTRAAATPEGLFEGAVQISPDKNNNALLIMATTRDYLNLRRMIRALDQPRRQVFVEAYIMEVTVDKDRDVGFGYHNGALVDGKTTVIGGVAHSGLNSAALNPIGLMGLAAMVQGPLIQGSAAALGLETGDLPAFGIVFQAMQADTNVNMLSSPHLLTTDNEEARIQVGENVPLRSGTSSLPAAAGADAGQLSMLAAYTQPVRYKDVGIELKLTPTIGDGDTISIKLEQEVSNVASEDFAGLGAKMAQRKLSTVVTVQDQQTVVIGGLIKEEERTEESKVPLLGDIPILGRFFRRDLTKKYKTNLLVVLTPYIIRDRSDLRRIFKQKLKERKEFIRRYTAFKDNAKLDRINFSSKRGLLAEIDAVGRNAERETALKKAARPAKRTALEVVRMGSASSSSSRLGNHSE
jgi:general secretion pathway protein D